MRFFRDITTQHVTVFQKKLKYNQALYIVAVIKIKQHPRPNADNLPMNVYSIRINLSFVSNLIFILFFGVLSLGLLNCGGNSSSNNSPFNTGGSTEPSGASSTNNSSSSNNGLNYTLVVEIDGEDLDLDVNLKQRYDLDLTIESSGRVIVYAQDFPKMVYRVCTTGSKTSFCDAYSDDTGGLDIDVVLDSCGRLVSDANCGNSDSSFFTGQLDDDGQMSIDNLSVRMRIFAVTDELDGFSASDSDAGLLVMNRLIIDLTTGFVSAGAFQATGEAVEDGDVTLVSAGSLSSTIPTLGGADFIATLEGEFEQDPL